MAGHAGSGKSSLAREIADRIGGVVIDLDTIKAVLLDCGADWDDASRWSYATLYALVDDVLTTVSAKVIVDTPSYWPEIHERLTSAADRNDADYVFVECDAPESIRALRLEQRPTRRSQVPGLGVNPLDAPVETEAVHLRPIQRPFDRLCLRVPTDKPVELDGLLVQLPNFDQLI